MKLKKALALMMSLTMIAVTVVGCSSDSGDSNGGTTDGGSDTSSGTETGGDDTSSEDDKYDKDAILAYGQSSVDGIFSPIMASNVYDSDICDMIFEKLIALTPEGEYVDSSIASWEISEDNHTYTFTLKDGVKFSDGEPLTTEDVYFTFSTIAHPDYNGPRSYAVNNMVGYEDFRTGVTDTFEGIKIESDTVISFTFNEGTASPSNIESFDYGIMPAHYYLFETWDEFIAYNALPMGSGPLMLEEDGYAPSQYTRLIRNDNYWDTENQIEFGGLYILNVPEESLISALQTDQIDIAMPSANSENLEALGSLPNVNVDSYLGNGYTFMAFNVTRPVLEDVRVRQALMYALDREAFIKAEYGEGVAEVGMAPISPTSWAFPEADALNAYEFDMDKANALMDEAGWTMGADGIREKDGQKMALTWLVYTDSPWPGTLSSMAADTWAQLGVDLTIELLDFNTVASRTMDAPIENKDFDIYTMGFSLSVDPDPTGALFDDNAYSEGGFNATGYKNADAMALVEAGRQTFDTDERAEIYKEWATIMNYEIPHVIIAYRTENWGINKRIEGMDLDTYTDMGSTIHDIKVLK